MTKDEKANAKAQEKLLNDGWSQLSHTYGTQYFCRGAEYVHVCRGNVFPVSNIADLLRLGFFDTDFTKEKIKALAQAIVSLEDSVENLGDEMRGYDR